MGSVPAAAGRATGGSGRWHGSAGSLGRGGHGPRRPRAHTRGELLGLQSTATAAVRVALASRHAPDLAAFGCRCHLELQCNELSHTTTENLMIAAQSAQWRRPQVAWALPGSATARHGSPPGGSHGWLGAALRTWKGSTPPRAQAHHAASAKAADSCGLRHQGQPDADAGGRARERVGLGEPQVE